MNLYDYRKPTYPIDKFFIERWSPRALSGDPVAHEALMSLFEAARWAPSSYNAQPWHFLYAKRETPHWKTYLDLMIEFNQQWAQHAAVLVVVISRKLFEHNGKPAVTHSFDAGAAWQNLALQAHLRGLVAHGMQGFDYEKAQQVLKIPELFQVEAMIAIGMPGKKENLPEAMQQREVPSVRKALTEIITEGLFPS